jgi:hypothetical protein
VVPTPVGLPVEEVGQLTAEQPIQYFELQAAGGSLLQVSVEAEAPFEAPVIEWQVFPGGQSGVGDSHLTLLTPREGAYVFGVREASFAGGEGYGFTFRVEQVDTGAFPERPEVEPNNDAATLDAIVGDSARVTGDFTVDEAMEMDQGQDWFSLELGVGDRVLAWTGAGDGEEADTTLELLGPAPDLPSLAMDDDGGVNAYSNLGWVDIGEAGTHFLNVEPFGAARGSYTLYVLIERAQP